MSTVLPLRTEYIISGNLIGGGGLKVALLKYTHWDEVFISVIDSCVPLV